MAAINQVPLSRPVENRTYVTEDLPSLACVKVATTDLCSAVGERFSGVARNTDALASVTPLTNMSASEWQRTLVVDPVGRSLCLNCLDRWLTMAGVLGLTKA